MTYLRMLSLAFVLCVFAVPRVSRAQAGKATVAGTVTDSAGSPINGVFVQVAHSMGESQGEVRTGSDGRFMIGDLDAGGPYVIAVRKVGFRPLAFYNVQLKANDTSKVILKLTRNAAALARVTVQAPPKGSPLASRSITAEEIDQHPVRSALDVLDRSRPTWLRGGLEECQAPDKVFVNGIRRDRPGQPIEEYLYDLHADDIQEMRYADCHTATLPAVKQNAIYVILKPGLK